VTPNTPPADAAPSRRSSRRPAAAVAPNGTGVSPGAGGLTRAEYRRLTAQSATAVPRVAAATESPAVTAVPVAAAPSDADSPLEPELTQVATGESSAAEEPSLVETVVADVAAAIVAETVAGAQPDEASRRRLRRAARAVFESVAAEAENASHAAEVLDAIADADGGAEVADVATGLRVEDVVVADTVDAAPLSASAQLPAGSVFVAPAASDDCELDEFEFAARLFSFTGETPVQRPVAEAAEPVAAAVAPAHVARRRPTRGATIVKRMVAASFSVGVMTVVGLLAVGTTTPAAAVASPSDRSATTSPSTVQTASQKLTKGSDADQIQAFVASGTDAPAALDRPESYNVTSMSELAAESGVRLFANTWVNDPSSPIQYPFPVGVPISAAFGSIAYMSEFATPHNGVDLTPGEGAEIHAVAAGTVRIATESGGDYGVTVLIDHIIDGQLVSTRYGHMQYGSLQVQVGDKVTAGEVIGRVGQTGKATGPHLHLEVLLGGTTRIDPMPWLAEHTKPGHTVG